MTLNDETTMCQVNNTRVRLSEPIKVYKVVKCKQYKDGVHYTTPYQDTVLKVGEKYRAKILDSRINLWCSEAQFYDNCEQAKELEDGFFHCFTNIEGAKKFQTDMRITTYGSGIYFSILECEVPVSAVVFKGEWSCYGYLYSSIAVSELKIIGPTT